VSLAGHAMGAAGEFGSLGGDCFQTHFQSYSYFCAKLQLVGTCALLAARDTIRVFPSGHAP
jgi:hypothetical protein